LLHVSQQVQKSNQNFAKIKLQFEKQQQNNLSKPVLVFQRITRADIFEMKLDFVKSVQQHSMRMSKQESN
jgi:hypothetical protein